jgi:transcriptional regulator with XRE-family HTH domain
VDDAEERAAAERLGALLHRLRTGVNLTQRELGRRAGISWTFIQLLEKGIRPDTKKPVTPSPQSLQKIAAGLAVDPLDRERKNPGKAAGLFNQMMEARGWSSDANVATSVSATPSLDDVREGLALLAGQEASVEFAALAENWYAMRPQSRRFVLDAIKYVREQEGLA